MEQSTARFQSEEHDRTQPGLLTVLEASRRAGVTQSAIIRWIRNGYLEATPSDNGWLIPSAQLARAAEAADEARGTSPVPRRTAPSLTPVPTPIRYTVERRTAVASQEAIGEHIVAPLAELIRDQIDVVHDQAEVIGWLQAERSRLTAELERLSHEDARQEQDPDPTDQPTNDPLALNENELYDEVLSLLWKTEDTEESQENELPAAETGPEPDHLADIDERAAIDALWDQELDATTTAAETVAPETEDDAVEEIGAEPEPVLSIEDYADPSWFFSHESYAVKRADAQRPRPTLQPIVPRRADVSEEQRELHKMIDETERKIADLWRTQEELRKSSPQVITQRESSQTSSGKGNRWHRIWPIRR